jgi:Crinkler effector protein N-terminal domain
VGKLVMVSSEGALRWMFLQDTTMGQESSKSSDEVQLRFIIERDVNPFKVKIGRDHDVDDLKTEIGKLAVYGALRGIDPKDLVLWKVRSKMI